jgi:hypothetical protein
MRYSIDTSAILDGWRRHYPPDVFPPLWTSLEELDRRRPSASHRGLVNTQRNRSMADPWVIALAQVNGCTVVTGEVPSDDLKRPKIPDVCRALGIPCSSLLQLFRKEGWVFRS